MRKAAALPFNAYGALGMAREEYDVDSASSQWFWLLFDSDLVVRPSDFDLCLGELRPPAGRRCGVPSRTTQVGF